MQTNADIPVRVLVVDDSQETLLMLTDVLEASEMTVTTAHDGREALNLINETTPDLVLMDALMPVMDGFEACQILKGEKRFEDVPVIFMTGCDDTEHVVRALSAGGVDFIAKPLPLDELFARIKVHLANARKTRSARMALDRTGRSIVASGVSGNINWTTPQAANLLSRAGLRCDEGDLLPLEVINWLGTVQSNTRDPQARLRLSKFGTCLEFRLLEHGDNGEILLRLLDCALGSDEERLAEAFDITTREADVLLWITHGKSNREVAEILSLSPRTVNKHLEQIFAKLGVENRTAAATMAVRVLWNEA